MKLLIHFYLTIQFLLNKDVFLKEMNGGGEPIVCPPRDTFKCFMGTDLDLLVIGNCELIKELQDKTLLEDYQDKYELD